MKLRGKIKTIKHELKKWNKSLKNFDLRTNDTKKDSNCNEKILKAHLAQKDQWQKVS